MADDDLVYLLRRAAEERARAVDSRHAKAQAIHSTLAQAYDDRAKSRSRVVKHSQAKD